MYLQHLEGWDPCKTKNLKLHIRDQCNTDFCWAIASITCVEYVYQLQRGKHLRLSVQQVIDEILSKDIESGDDGNTYQNVFIHMKSHRVTLAKYYPFIGTRGVAKMLRRHEKKKSYKIDGFEAIDIKNEKQVMRILKERGPIVVGMSIDNKFDDVKEEIYEGTSIPPKLDEELGDDELCHVLSESEPSEDSAHDSSDSYSSDLERPDDYEDDYFDDKDSSENGDDETLDEALEESRDHAMVLLGYGTKIIGGERVHYWIAQNSYGYDWGINGIGRIRRASSIRAPYYDPILDGAIPILRRL
ncbi:hypothetical protein MLD38_016219 [Melastoma candidum]|uniref:Uncharacterized protein n=1 Tax=Melastoma candidum TaxID=119954 RepID=A0ACB9RJW3_9MYRT|nr:hypothetical protein MLD38_016219 [Melastoma candidum]